MRFRVPDADAQGIADALKERGVLVMVTGADSFRTVLHLQVSVEDVRTAVKAIKEETEAAL